LVPDLVVAKTVDGVTRVPAKVVADAASAEGEVSVPASDERIDADRCRMADTRNLSCSIRCIPRSR
jgi:hypothetical protein